MNILNKYELFTYCTSQLISPLKNDILRRYIGIINEHLEKLLHQSLNKLSDQFILIFIVRLIMFIIKIIKIRNKVFYQLNIS